MQSPTVLKSWKEISAYLGVSIRTSQRWDRDLGLPIHRTRSKKGSAVLGIKEELQTWLQTRPVEGIRLDNPAAEAPQQRKFGAPAYGGTLVTDLLWKRPSRPTDPNKEIAILQRLTLEIAKQNSKGVLDNLVTEAMELCKADSSGISLATTSETGKSVFRWVAASGGMNDHLGGETPRHFSPCGVCLERNAPQLFSYPERFFTYLQDLGLPMAELLLIPFYADPQCCGTVWIFCHDARRKFDREDARILTSLTDLVGAALRIMTCTKDSAEPPDALKTSAMARKSMISK